MTSFIFRSHIHGQVRTEWAVVCLQKSHQELWSFSFWVEVDNFSSCLCSSYLPLQYLFLFFPPPLRATRSVCRQWTWWKRRRRQPTWHRWSGCSDTWRHSCTSSTSWISCWPWNPTLQGRTMQRKETGVKKERSKEEKSEDYPTYRLEVWETRLTRERLASLQHLLDVSHHDPLHVLQLRVDAAKIPPRSAVNVRLLGFLDVGVCGGSSAENISSYADESSLFVLVRQLYSCKSKRQSSDFFHQLCKRVNIYSRLFTQKLC